MMAAAMARECLGKERMRLRYHDIQMQSEKLKSEHFFVDLIWILGLLGTT